MNEEGVEQNQKSTLLDLTLHIKLINLGRL